MSQEADANLADDRALRVVRKWLVESRPLAPLGRAMIAYGAYMLAEGASPATVAVVLETLAAQIRQDEKAPTEPQERAGFWRRLVDSITTMRG